MRKLLWVPALALFSFASFTLAQGFVPLAPIPGLTEGGAASSNDLAPFFNNLYKYVIGLSATLAVIMIIWGGLEISTQDSVSKQSDGKERIRQAIYGLILVLSPVLVFSIINPSILRLSLNLPALDLSVDPKIFQVSTSPAVYSSAQAGSWCCETGNSRFVCASSQKACQSFESESDVDPSTCAVGSCSRY